MFVNLCDSLAFSQESFLKIFKNKIIKKIVKIYSNSSLHQNIGKLLTYIFLEQQLEQWLRKLGCLAVKSSFSDDKKFSQYMFSSGQVPVKVYCAILGKPQNVCQVHQQPRCAPKAKVTLLYGRSP